MNKMRNPDFKPLLSAELRCRFAATLVLLSSLGAACDAWADEVPAGSVIADAEHAAAETGPAGWPESDTVRDLLHADTQAARAAARLPRQAADWLHHSVTGNGRLATTSHQTGQPSPDRVHALAIYGVGKSLQADVMVNGTVWRYRAGRTMPLEGDPAHGAGYALVGIEVPCVRLVKVDQPYTACVLSTEVAHD